MPGEEERETFGVDSLADDCVGDIGAVDHEGGVLAPPFNKRQTIRNPYIYIYTHALIIFSVSRCVCCSALTVTSFFPHIPREV